MNTINSPTATNLARGTIIELAQNVYNNALAAQEQADRAADVIAEGVNDAADEADRAGVARLAAEAAALAADGAATAADGAWRAAEAAADRAEAAAEHGGGGGVELNASEFPDGYELSTPASGTWDNNAFIVVSGVNTSNNSAIVGVVPVWILYANAQNDMNFTPALDIYQGVMGSRDSIRIYNVANPRFVLYGG